MRQETLLTLFLTIAVIGSAQAEPINPAPASKQSDVMVPDAKPGAQAGKVEATEDTAGMEATTTKFNAYIAYMNRTLRAIDSLDRYKSWVNMKTGPTGHERYIYGLYEVYDVTDERADAVKELTAAPLLPDLDAAMRTYIAANDKLAPELNKAAGYYSREDYKLDHMAQGKVFHAEIAQDGDAFLAARAKLDAVMTREKLQLDMIRLATIEKHEGRDARWQVANVMMRAKQTLDALQGGHGGDVDMPTFDTAMSEFGAATRTFDDYRVDHPNAAVGFSTYPDDLLGHLREVQGRLARTHGSLRRSGGLDMTFILTDYNTMVTTSELPMDIDGK